MIDASDHTNVEAGPCAPSICSPNYIRGSVVDVFCGVGALSHGFLLEGFRVAAGIDVDAACRFAYENNNHARFLAQDVETITGPMINELFAEGEPRILIGCAPCQPFSMYTQKRIDEKWKLLTEFKRLVHECEPDFLSMENVPRLVRYQDGELFADFVRSLEKAGYSVWWRVVKCADYGVPQTRRRLVVLASRNGDIKLVPATHARKDYVTVGQAISRLPPIGAGEQHPEDPLHRSQALSALNLARIRAAKPGGSWRDWKKELVADCHLKPSGRGYSSVYGRMTEDELAPTITTQCYGFGNGRFGHPTQDRALSIREAALLQTFPPYYKFFPPKEKCSLSTIGKWIGNAVPVELAKAVARSIALQIKEAADA